MKAEEDGVEWIGIGKVKNTNNPPTMVLELVVCGSFPVVCPLHCVGLVLLGVSDPRVCITLR